MHSSEPGTAVVFSPRTFCACAPRPLPSDDRNAIARRQEKHPGGDGVKGVLVHEIADDENQRYLRERKTKVVYESVTQQHVARPVSASRGADRSVPYPDVEHKRAIPTISDLDCVVSRLIWRSSFNFGSHPNTAPWYMKGHQDTPKAVLMSHQYNEPAGSFGRSTAQAQAAEYYLKFSA